MTLFRNGGAWKQVANDRMAIRNTQPQVLGPKQLAWLREHIPSFADAERKWKTSREDKVTNAPTP